MNRSVCGNLQMKSYFYIIFFGIVAVKRIKLIYSRCPANDAFCIRDVRITFSVWMVSAISRFLSVWRESNRHILAGHKVMISFPHTSNSNLTKPLRRTVFIVRWAITRQVWSREKKKKKKNSDISGDDAIQICICNRAHTGAHVPNGKLCNDVETRS